MMFAATALQTPAGTFTVEEPSPPTPEDRHARRVYVAGTLAAVLFLGTSIGAVAGWLSAAAYLLSAAASAGALCMAISLGHSRSPAVRARQRITSLRRGAAGRFT